MQPSTDSTGSVSHWNASEQVAPHSSLPKLSIGAAKPASQPVGAPARPTLVFSLQQPTQQQATTTTAVAAPATPAAHPTAPTLRFPTTHIKQAPAAPPPQQNISYPSPKAAPAPAASIASPYGTRAASGASKPTRWSASVYDNDSDQEDYAASRAPAVTQRSPAPRRVAPKKQIPEPENDDDAMDDNDIFDEDEEGGAGAGSGSAASIIDKILGHRRLVPAKNEPETAENPNAGAVEGQTVEDQYEYLIKWRGMSYLHITWVTAEYLRSLGIGGRARLLKYWKHKAREFGIEEEEGFFPADYVEVERVIAERDEVLTADDGTQKTVKQYLVKWAGLPFSDCAWETAEDIQDDDAIEKYRKRNAYKGPITYPTPPLPTAFRRMLKSPIFKDGNELRAYQLEGLNWLVFNWYHRRGCILADEMGLGKTVQSITLLDFLFRNERIPGPFLAIVPLSTLGHWQREVESWTEMNVIVYSGNKETRQMIRQYEWLYAGTQQIKFHVLLTTYEMLMAEDWTELARVPWKCCVIDEAQRLKNSNSKLAQNLKHFRIAHRVLLTGTPIQNNTTELWSLLNFIAPDQFSHRELFTRRFGNLQSKEQVDELHRLLKPFLLRRLKGDVEKSIPPKEETIIEVELSKLQKQYYRAILDRNRTFLNKGLSQKNTPNLVNVMMQLRKVCNHPYLIKGCEENDLVGVPPDQHLYKLIHASSKMILLDKLLLKLKEGGHKVLIFSQMVRVLDLLEHFLHARNYKTERLDGGVRGNERQAAIDRFCAPNSDRFVFLLCTRAGGVGINLAAADTVIIYDSDWNPQNDIQAQARCHRIGQTQEVKVYRLLTSKTYERGMFERASRKLGLDQAVLSNMGVASDPNKALDDKEIDTLLKYGAYDLFRNADNDAEEPEELKQDINTILERSTKFVWGNNQASNPNSSFAKATFQSSTDDGADVDLTSPTFWDDILPEGRTMRWLEKAIENQAASLVEDPKEKEKFIIALEERVNEFVQEWKEGAGEISVDTEALIRVLTQCQSIAAAQSSLFTQGEIEKMASWLSEVSNPKRKRRNAASAAVAIFSNLGNEAGKPPGPSSAASSSPYVAAQVPMEYMPLIEDEGEGDRVWSKEERIAFHEAFVMCPDSRWEFIQGTASNGALQNKTLEEIYLYARKFLQVCVQISSDKEEKASFQEVLESLLPPARSEIEAEIARNGGVDRTWIKKPNIASDSTYKKMMNKKAKGWARRLKLFSSLRSVIESAEIPEAQFEAPATSGAQRVANWIERIKRMPLYYATRPMARWWTREEDRSLLIGSVKHGIGRYDVMMNDPELTFAQYLPRINAAATSSMVVIKAQPEPTMVDDAPGDGAPGEANAEMPTPAEAPIAASSEMPVPDANEMQVDASSSTTATSIAPGASSTITPYATESLYRVNSCSSNVNDVAPDSTDLRLKFNITHLRSHLQDNWPDSRMLDSHFKAIIEQIKLARRAIERDAALRRRTIEKEEKKKKTQEIKKGERQKSWTKKEEKELRAAIMMFGGGYWEVLKIQAGLDLKTDEQVKEYFFNLLAICRRIVNSSAFSVNSASTGRPYDDDDGADVGGGLDDSMEVDIVNSMPVSNAPSTPEDARLSWPMDPSDLLSGGNMCIPGTNQVGLMVTPTMARRYLRRVKLFQDIRTKVLVHEQLRERLALIRANEMPPWWVPVVTDQALLESVIRYGIGGPEPWVDFLADPNCPLYAEVDGSFPPERFEMKRAFFRDFLVDKAPLLSRLEFLVQCVLSSVPGQPQPALESPSYASPVKSDPQQSHQFQQHYYTRASSEGASHASYPAAGSASSVFAATQANAAAAANSSGRVSTRANGKRKHIVFDPDYGIPEPKRQKHNHDEDPTNRMSTRSVPRDENFNVILPVQAKGATIHTLGHIIYDQPNYHARNYIWPVGFRSTRKMPSIKNPNQQVVYTSEIVENGDSPGFRVTPADMPEMSMTFNTASRVWMEMLRKIKRRQSISVSGPEMYGYSDPTVRMLIQELDNAELCENYQWQNFDGSWTREDKVARAAGKPVKPPPRSAASPVSATQASLSSGRPHITLKAGGAPLSAAAQKYQSHSKYDDDFEEEEVYEEEEEEDTEESRPPPPQPVMAPPATQPRTISLTMGPTTMTSAKAASSAPAAAAPLITPESRLLAEQQLRELNERLARISERQKMLQTAKTTGGAAGPKQIRRPPKPSAEAPTHGLHMDGDDHMGMGAMDIDSSHHDDSLKHTGSVASDGSMTPLEHLGEIDPLPSDLGDAEMQMMIENFD